jgi:glycine/D-amino acid oxidase-like deaminating enzyme
MLAQVFDPAMYRFESAVPSYWEATAKPLAYPQLQTNIKVDVAVIGGGYTGLSAALHLASDGISVAVLEAGHIGWGASGRNGGFVCFPSAKLGLSAMIKRYGLEATRHYYRTQAEGAELTMSLIRDNGIEADLTGEGHFNVAQHPALFAGVVEDASAWTKLLGIKTQIYSAEEFRAIGHGGTESFGASRYWPSAAIHPLKFAIGLGQAAAKAGAQLFAHSKVERWARDGGAHHLITAQGSVHAGKVIVATNGYTPDGLRRELDRRIIPAISNIIVTRPLSEDELERHQFRTFSPLSNERNLLYYYRRLPDNRILFGGRGDTTGRDRDGETVKQWLSEGLFRCFPDWRGIKIDYFWRGLVCMTRDLVPKIGALPDDPSTFFALAYHGNGVANAPWAGRALAHAISRSNTGQPAVSPVQSGLPKRMPPGQWTRRLALRGAYIWFQHKDRKAERG